VERYHGALMAVLERDRGERHLEPA